MKRIRIFGKELYIMSEKEHADLIDDLIQVEVALKMFRYDHSLLFDDDTHGEVVRDTMIKWHKKNLAKAENMTKSIKQRLNCF